MQTRENAGILLSYLERRLDADTAAWLERHSAGCEQCRAVLESQRRVWTALDSWQPAEISEDFDQRLWSRIREEEESGWQAAWLGWFEWLPGRPAMAVAALCLVLVAGVLFRNPDESGPVGKPAQSWTVEPVEADLVEGTLEDLEMLRQLGVPARPEEAPRSSL